jgi:thymidylate synthase ThyX
MKVFLFDEFPPETSAMLQALYSRSGESVINHVEVVRLRGTDKFMASYYVGYGHASIGDCGSTTLYLEDISLVACKAVQDNQLYSGQETSTRYIDFAARGFLDPVNTPRSRGLQERWLSFYSDLSKPIAEYLKAQFPRSSDVKAATWEKAIAARGFDIARGFLPAGVLSQMSWTTSLRQAHDHVFRLECHPLSEVRILGAALRSLLQAQYPNSFGHRVSDAEVEFQKIVGEREAYFAPTTYLRGENDFEATTDIDNDALEAQASPIIANRPRRAALPKSLARFGTYRCRFLLDYGSFRDLQRHRGGLCRVPLLNSNYGFHSWYLAELPPHIQARARAFVEGQLRELADIIPPKLAPSERQYYYPIGMKVPCELHYDLAQMVYVSELRSGTTVHPTLRMIAHRMASKIRENHPKLTLYADFTDDTLSVRRGAQDIIDRGAA